MKVHIVTRNDGMGDKVMGVYASYDDAKARLMEEFHNYQWHRYELSEHEVQPSAQSAGYTQVQVAADHFTVLTRPSFNRTGKFTVADWMNP